MFHIKVWLVSHLKSLYWYNFLMKLQVSTVPTLHRKFLDLQGQFRLFYLYKHLTSRHWHMLNQFTYLSFRWAIFLNYIYYKTTTLRKMVNRVNFQFWTPGIFSFIHSVCLFIYFGQLKWNYILLLIYGIKFYSLMEPIGC